jgi:hypothetical protein
VIFGFNTEVKIGSNVFHVQTEDHGSNRHQIETTVYMGGRLIHRRKTSYEELLDSPNFSDAALRQRLEEQHKLVIDELRAGTLTFDVPSGKVGAAKSAAPAAKAKEAPAPRAAVTPAPPAQREAEPEAAPAPRTALITPPPAASAPAPAPAKGDGQAQVLNPASWYASGTATLKIDVKSKATNQPLADAMLLVVIQSPQGPITFAAKSDNKGRVELVFPLPRMGPGGADVIIKAPGEDEIKYSLKPTTA